MSEKSTASSNPPPPSTSQSLEATAEQSHPTPNVTKDARYRASRKMKQTGQHLGAANMLKNLLGRALEEFGDSSIETAAVYYELGHSLFLDSSTINGSIVDADAVEEALEYMAKSCAILYAHADDGMDNKSKHSDNNTTRRTGSANYSQWAKDHIPRVLIGIGDLHSYQQKHAEAIEVLLNAIPYREEAAKEYNMNKDAGVDVDVSSLRIHRLLAEVYVLAAEELLLCPRGEDQIHGETQNVVVKGEEVGRLAQSFYEQAKEQLQEIGKWWLVFIRIPHLD
jgi:hypothetical protein